MADVKLKIKLQGLDKARAQAKGGRENEIDKVRKRNADRRKKAKDEGKPPIPPPGKRVTKPKAKPLPGASFAPSEFGMAAGLLPKFLGRRLLASAGIAGVAEAVNKFEPMLLEAFQLPAVQAALGEQVNGIVSQSIQDLAATVRELKTGLAGLLGGVGGAWAAAEGGAQLGIEIDAGFLSQNFEAHRKAKESESATAQAFANLRGDIRNEEISDAMVDFLFNLWSPP
jgi:hypothetical protein